MMRPIRNAVLAAPLALLAACGGSSAPTASPTFTNAAPSYGALAMDETSTDASTSSVALGEGAVASSSQALLALGADCHPHLFARTHEVVVRANRHLYKFLRHVEQVMARAPQVVTGTTHVWESAQNGLDRRFTITKVSEAVFSWKLELAAVGSGAGFVTVFQGQIDRTGATGAHQGSGSMTLDLTALHDLVPTEKVLGQISATFDSSATSRKVEVTATNVSWDVQDLPLDAATITALEQPRSGHYVYFREPGTGGSLKVKDQMIFLCPANPGLSLADVAIVSRWYKLADGSVHGRSDGVMTGGQLAAPVASVQGVTCHASASEGALQAESYWMMKSEDATGATIAAQSSASTVDGATAIACDTAFGAVPATADAGSDYDFAAIDFADGSVVPFPNMR